MKTYCKSCGQANSYIGKKPSFCGSCGEELDKISLATNQNAYIRHQSDKIIYKKNKNPFLGAMVIEASKESIDGEQMIDIKI